MLDLTSLLQSVGLSPNIFSHGHRTGPDDAPTELVWLLDNTASLSPDGKSWTSEFVAAYFAKNTGEEASKTLANICKTLGVTKDQETKKVIEKRLMPFFNLILPGRTCQIRHGLEQAKVGSAASSSSSSNVQSTANAQPIKLGPSGASGISTNQITLAPGTRSDGDILSSTVLQPVTACVPSHTTFATATGWAVISDIDDTIKKTLTRSATGMLKTTFAEEPVPIAGMPEFYKHMVQILSNPPFWYLSASPYNLYQFLHEFRDMYYPFGTMVLREASWMNVAGFLASLTQGTKEYKVKEIEKIHARFPGRKMICLGDSTQSDPEAYATSFRKYPGWVRAIFIRKVENVTEITDELTPGDDEKKRNSKERFEKAFEGVPSSVWHVFTDPKELYEKLDEAVKE